VIWLIGLIPLKSFFEFSFSNIKINRMSCEIFESLVKENLQQASQFVKANQLFQAANAYFNVVNYLIILKSRCKTGSKKSKYFEEQIPKVKKLALLYRDQYQASQRAESKVVQTVDEAEIQKRVQEAIKNNPNSSSCSDEPEKNKGEGRKKGNQCDYEFPQVPMEELRKFEFGTKLIGMQNEVNILRTRLVDQIEYAGIFEQANIRNTGLMLYGPGGTGKTSLIKGFALETKLPMHQGSPSTIAGIYTSQAEQCLKKIIETASNNGDRGGIVFLDEADGLLVEKKGSPSKLTQTFKEMVQPSRNVPPTKGTFLIVAGTNDPFEFANDEALLRRFPLRLFVGLPNAEIRKKLIIHQLKEAKDCYGKSFEVNFTDKEWEDITDFTIYYTPANIVLLASEVLGQGKLGIFNLANQVYKEYKDNNGDTRYNVFLRSELASTQGYLSITDERFKNPLEQKKICFPKPDYKTFMQVLTSGIIKTETSRPSLQRFRDYAQKVDDTNGVAQIDQYLEEITLTIDRLNIKRTQRGLAKFVEKV
jgi:ATP-dependent 26S proteasome regulatory subunit